MIRPASDRQLAEAQARLREQVAPASKAAQIANLDTVERLIAYGRFAYRGNEYQVEPISYLDGAELQKYGSVIMRLSGKLDETLGQGEGESDLRELLVAFEGCVALMHRLAKPTRTFGRLGEWWSGNPFSKATTTELGELMAFFSLRRTASSIALSGWRKPTAPSPGALISPTTWLGSLTDSPRGLDATDTRSATKPTLLA